jgi:methylglutamate dehydrogenase subunit D
MLEPSPNTLQSTSQVQPLPHRQIVSLAAFRGRQTALRQALAADLPSTPRRITQNGTTYLWSGPDTWLAISETPSLFQDICTEAQNLAAITEQSDGRSLIRVTGPHARAALAKLVPIDLHETAFPPDAVALTLAAHIGITLWREEYDSFVLACFRSYAGALHHALLEAAAEFETARG